MKKFALILSIFMCLFLFTGCGVSGALVKENSDGSLDVYYSAGLDIENLVNNGTISSEDVVGMKSAVEVKASELIAKCKFQYNFNLNKYYNNGMLSNEERVQLYKQLNIYTGWNDYTYVVKFHFTTTEAYRVYVNYGSDIQVIKYTDIGFFTTKFSEKAINPFGRSREIFDGECAFTYFKNLIDQYINEHFSAEIVALIPEFTMVYSYVTTNSRLHTDADQTVLTNAGYLHTWEINKNNCHREIEFYSLSANPVAWYFVALTIAFMFSAIFLVVIYFKKPSKKFDSLDINL